MTELLVEESITPSDKNLKHILERALQREVSYLCWPLADKAEYLPSERSKVAHLRQTKRVASVVSFESSNFFL